MYPAAPMTLSLRYEVSGDRSPACLGEVTDMTESEARRAVQGALSGATADRGGDLISFFFF